MASDASRVTTVLTLGVLAVLGALGLLLTTAAGAEPQPMAGGGPASPASAIPIAVLGDSNSHSYGDTILYPPDKNSRSGFRASTLQWPEVLARMRVNQLDLGPWVRWGNGGVLGRAGATIGLRTGRVPAKEDYLYNFAHSGARCRDLTDGFTRQAKRLADLMDDESARWANGVVVIAIGVNDWIPVMPLQAREPMAAGVRAVIDDCKKHIGEAVALIHARHPGARILIAGMFNEADDPDTFDSYLNGVEKKNIDAGVAAYDGALRELAKGQPNVAFFDNVAWFKSLWGERGADGKPNYHPVDLGGGLRITNTAGDDPHNALLADHHPGLPWNVLWVQALVARLNEAFGMKLTPISQPEVHDFIAARLKPTVSANR